MVRIFDPQIHIEVWPKLDYASTLFTYMTSLMSLENWSVKQKELTRMSFINSQYCVLYLHHVGLNRLLSPKDIIHELLFPFFSCRIHDSDGFRFSYYSPRLPLAPLESP